MSEELKELAKRFRPPAFPGSYFLSFEGIEGAGKSTQINQARDYLESKGFRVLVLREPGGTPFGEKLRQAILNSTQDLHPMAECHLFLSSRAQLLHEVTLKELGVPGTIIIYDRYIDSSLAYQGKARGLGLDTILELHKNFPLTLTPHKTIYIRIDLETSYQRQKMRNAPRDYFESQGQSFYQNLIDGYDQAAELFPHRIDIVNGLQSQDGVFQDIIKSLDSLISGR